MDFVWSHEKKIWNIKLYDTNDITNKITNDIANDIANDIPNDIYNTNMTYNMTYNITNNVNSVNKFHSFELQVSFQEGIKQFFKLYLLSPKEKLEIFLDNYIYKS